jgi:hypothetical protein
MLDETLVKTHRDCIGLVNTLVGEVVKMRYDGIMMPKIAQEVRRCRTWLRWRAARPGRVGEARGTVVRGKQASWNHAKHPDYKSDAQVELIGGSRAVYCTHDGADVSGQPKVWMQEGNCPCKVPVSVVLMVIVWRPSSVVGSIAVLH